MPQWTVRKEYGIDATYNAVHGSDSVSSALRELELLGVFFSGEALAGLL